MNPLVYISVFGVIGLLILAYFVIQSNNNKLDGTPNQQGGLCAKKYNNLNNMLNINLNPNNPAVNALEGVLESGCDIINPSASGNPSCLEQPGHFNMPEYSCTNQNLLSRRNIDLITENQPRFLGDTMIRNYYDKLYYNDADYPVRPISTDFAKNPDEYCCKNPMVYPCYVRSSRYDLQ